MENSAQTDIALLIAAGCMGMLILVASIILFVVYYQKKVLAQKNDFQKQLLKATVQVEEKERERIAKNIHDEVGILLTALRQNVNRSSRNAADTRLVEEINRENDKLLEDSIQAVRGAIRDLTPKNLNKYGYLGVLRELSAQLNKVEHTQIEFTHMEDSPELSQENSLQLYRLTKELLNNVMKHAGATKIHMDFNKKDKDYRLYIAHNGKGISDEEVKALSRQEKGLGLKSIESRAQLVNARVHYGAASATEKAYIEVIIEHE